MQRASFHCEIKMPYDLSFSGFKFVPRLHSVFLFHSSICNPKVKSVKGPEDGPAFAEFAKVSGVMLQ